MDLKELKVREDGARLYLVHPVTGEYLTYGEEEENQMYLVLLSHDSKEYAKKQRQIHDARTREAQKNRNFKLTAERLEQDANELLASITIDGVLFVNGEEVKINSKNAEEYYNEYRWIKEQVDTFVHDRSNFLSN